jgi:hypothetical protein
MRICSFLLANGHRCQCVANRDQDFCRHHTPQALRLHDAAEAGEFYEEASDHFSARREWGHLRLDIAQAQDDQFPDYIEALMTNMDAGRMSPRTAGRLLLVLYHRREELKCQPSPLAEELPQQPPRDPAFDLTTMDAYIRQARAKLAHFEETHGIEPHRN